MISLYKPHLDELWFREEMLEDELTMSFNHAYGGVISFPKEKWERWYQLWLNDNDHHHFYRYLKNENNDYVGEVAYHLDNHENIYLIDILIYAPFRSQGYAKEGLKLLINEMKEKGVSSAYDNVAIDNVNAINLLVNFGFIEQYRNDEIVMLKYVIK